MVGKAIFIALLLIVEALAPASLKAAGFRKSFAIVVGIDRYQSDHWQNLPNSVNDARGMSRYLENQGYQVKTFLQKEAVKDAILSYMEDTLAPRINEEDRFLFYFSGHGETVPLGGSDYGYIVPYDGQEGKYSTWISMDNLRELARKLGLARHQLYIFDSCFGGLFAEKSAMSAIDVDFPNYIDRVASQKARQYLTAGGKGERVPASGPKPGYSYFTGYLLEALEDGKADMYPDGYITATELHSYLEAAASSSSQTPRGGTIAGHMQGNFLFSSPFPVKDQSQPEPAESVFKGGTELKEQPAAAVLHEPFSGMELVRIAGGCFEMGQTEAERALLIREEGEENFHNSYGDEGPRHRVCLDSFWLGKYEVTMAQFRHFVQATGYSTDAERNTGGYAGCYVYTDGSWHWQEGSFWQEVGFAQEGDFPVACVSFNDAREYITWLSRRSGKAFRLPTEAEWEYAARGGTQTSRYWGNGAESDACRYANVANERYVAGTFPCDDGFRFAAPVGRFTANGYGLFDMLGNVWEWCGDWYGQEYYQDSSSDNPRGPHIGVNRVNRGGSWGHGPCDLRAANRGRGMPALRDVLLGFRLALSPDE